jgi:predicted solute-binding protein
VRSILLVSKCPPGEIHTLSADTSSRTSVELCRIILSRKYRVEPRVQRHAPDVGKMLADADAALVIGDPALRIDPQTVGYRVLDLGGEWVELTGLPMVFAVWAGHREHITAGLRDDLLGSVRYGREHLEDVISHESAARGFDPSLARQYLTRHIVNELGPRDYDGLAYYLKAAVELGALAPAEPVLH